MTTAAAAGLLTGLSLIVAIGAQNAFVLRQGLARQYVGPVVAVCALADALLITAGVSGIGAIVEHADWVLDVVRWLGVAFLVTYAAMSLWRARKPETLEAARAGAPSRRSAVGRALALTFLNPHVYLDTVLLLGSIANQQGGRDRWWFAAGAVVASIVWFTGLGYGAGAFQRLLATPRAWQVLDVLIGLTMLAIALSLALG
ncbi:amino acid transporter [Nocardioides silvaticus]|uniref:Amino acid transporter n=1 Tax=Nocardioides silvaticus TaxID=2201891 RepID=A0A316TF35_9ACTN|nr:LysE/ArgO family amino acid transporter [Nocardioides silvaticus]PWN03133.1 amino acid transporter [Nocardioides silvaticus]